MKLRTTIILALLTAALLAYIIVQERRQPGTREKMTLQTKPFAFKAADADEIEIERKDDTLRILLRQDVWHIGQPFEDPADPDLVKQILEAVPATEWVETIERGDLRKEDLKSTGLTDDGVRVTIRRKGAPLAQLTIGAPAALDGCSYASTPENKDQIHIAKTTLPALLAKAEDDWRDPKLVRIKPETITRFTMNAGTGAMEFARAAGRSWDIVKPIQTRASDDRVNAVVTAFLNLKVKPTKIATPAPTGAADVPAMSVVFEAVGLPKPITVTMHPNADPSADVQAQSSNREGIFLATAKVNDFWKLQPNHLRDQYLVHIPKEQATKLRIRSLSSAEIVLDKEGETWMLKRFGTTEPANQDRVTRLIDTLNAAQVRDFLSDTASNLEPWGLHQPFLSVEWSVADKNTQLDFGQGPDGIVTARVSDKPASIYRSEARLVNAIPPDSLRWRGTQLLNASIFSVRRIVLSEGDRPALSLFHNPDDATWTASTAGRDITTQLDKARANQLLQKLTDFQASDWNSDRAGAITALKNPSLTIQVLLTDPKNPAAEAKPVTLTFAPLEPGKVTAVYHGRRDQDPDTFLITREVYHELTDTVLR